jgi:hypothetical protein
MNSTLLDTAIIYPSQITQQGIQRRSKTYSFLFSASLFVSASISPIGFGVAKVQYWIDQCWIVTELVLMRVYQALKVG